MRNKLLLTVIAITGVAWLLWPSSQSDTSEGIADSGSSVLVNRIWIERIPETPNDKFDILVMVHDSDDMGSFVNSSAYEGDFSLFTWAAAGRGKFALTMLQTERTHQVRFRVSSRDCRGFDYCVRMRGAPRGAGQYYSMKDWVINSADAARPEALRQFITRELSER